jgi:hypothetical protein
VLILYSCHYIRTRVQLHAPIALPLVRAPVAIAQEAGSIPGFGLDGYRKQKIDPHRDSNLEPSSL